MLQYAYDLNVLRTTYNSWNLASRPEISRPLSISPSSLCLSLQRTLRLIFSIGPAYLIPCGMARLPILSGNHVVRTNNVLTLVMIRAPVAAVVHGRGRVYNETSFRREQCRCVSSHGPNRVVVCTYTIMLYGTIQ